ncbi:MAG: hypothetical protein OEM23_03990 [Gemmatimonadota bacterium]|nr:hypothetical protein [Gemmatimonadota bacterium]
MVRRKLESVRFMAVASLVVFAAACGDDPTGPGSGDPFDIEQSSQDFGVVQTAFTANLDVADDMGFVLPVLEGIGPAARRFERVSIPSEPTILSMARTTRLSVGSGASVQPILPSDVLGKTFEWSDLEGGYVVSARTGAPPNGLRVIVYDRTATPFVEVGFVDVTDESDPTADRLHVRLEKDGLTRLDYTVEATQSTSAVAVVVDGFITDGVERVNFHVSESAEETESGATLTVGYVLAMEGRPLSVSFSTTLNIGATLSAELTATFVNGSNVLSLSMSQDETGAIDGTVTWNGNVVMTVTGTGEGEPIFLGPEGEALTPAQAQAIAEMFELVEEGLFFLVSNLVFLGAGLT